MFAQNFINKRTHHFQLFFVVLLIFHFGIYRLGCSTTLAIAIDKWTHHKTPTPTPQPIPNKKEGKKKKGSSHKIGY